MSPSSSEAWLALIQYYNNCSVSLQISRNVFLCHKTKHESELERPPCDNNPPRIPRPFPYVTVDVMMCMLPIWIKVTLNCCQMILYFAEYFWQPGANTGMHPSSRWFIGNCFPATLYQLAVIILIIAVHDSYLIVILNSSDQWMNEWMVDDDHHGNKWIS